MPSAILTLNIISRWLNYILVILITVFGCIGGTLTILVFIKRRSFRRNSTTTYLLAGAIITVVHLPSIYFQSVLIDGFGLGVYNTNDIVCRLRNYFFYVTTVAAVSFPCWTTFDQYTSRKRDACFRHRWSSICNRRNDSLLVNYFSCMWNTVWY